MNTPQIANPDWMTLYYVTTNTVKPGLVWARSLNGTFNLSEFVVCISSFSAKSVSKTFAITCFQTARQSTRTFASSMGEWKLEINR